jgi:hypothetical protein
MPAFLTLHGRKLQTSPHIVTGDRDTPAGGNSCGIGSALDIRNFLVLAVLLQQHQH